MLEKFPANNLTEAEENEKKVPDYSAVYGEEKPSEVDEEESKEFYVSEETPYGPTLRKKSNIDDLKTRINEINTLVRENKMDTEVADIEVALAEEEIRSLEQENKKEFTEAEDIKEDEIEKIEEEENKIDTEAADMEVALEEEKIKEEIGDIEEDEPEEEENPESTEMDEYEIEKKEYLQLKKEFKSAEKKYYDAIKSDYRNRGNLNKFFGLGRNDMNPNVQEAYDEFMAANKSYYGFAQNNGVYQKIAERLYREKKEDEEVAINSAIAGRHVLTPAEKRLELQTIKMPERLVHIKDKILDKIKDYPVAVKTTAVALIGYSLFVKPAAVVAGVGTRYLGNKFYVNTLKKRQEATKINTEELIDELDKVNLEEMENEYFTATNKAHNAKNRVKMAAVGAAVGTGILSSMDFGTDSVGTKVNVDNSVDIDVKGVQEQDIAKSVTEHIRNQAQESGMPAPSGVEITPEPVEKAMISEDYGNLTHIMKMEDMNGLSFGDRIIDKFTREQITELHEILADTLAKGIQEGDIVLPDPLIVDGVDYTNNLAGYVAEKLPDVSRSWGDVLTPDELTQEQWQMFGIRSGDPNSMYLGEKVKIGELLKYIMRDELATSPPGEVPVSETVKAVTASEAIKSAVPQSNADSIAHESIQNGHKYGIGEDGTLYKDGKPMTLKNSGEVQDITHELTKVSKEVVAENAPPEILEKLMSTTKPTDYVQEKLLDGGEKWTNTRNPNDFMEIKDGEKFFSKDFLNKN